MQVTWLFFKNSYHGFYKFGFNYIFLCYNMIYSHRLVFPSKKKSSSGFKILSFFFFEQKILSLMMWEFL